MTPQGKLRAGVDGITGAAIPMQIKDKREADAIRFVQEYYNSPGFRERFDNFNNFILPQYYSDSSIRAIGPRDKVILNKGPYMFESLRRDPYFINNAYYDRNHTIWMGPIDFSKNNPNFASGDYGSGYDDVLAHELGHAVDNSIKLKAASPPIFEDGDTIFSDAPATTYSDLYKIFRRSKSYNDAIRSMDVNDKYVFLKYPSESGGDELHDARPSEAYADLMKLRYLLYKLGIFDSRKSGLKFNIKHLQLFKNKDKSSQRLFNNFSDDDVIWMMNNVAYNKKVNPRQV